jgi:hypothetical protein
MTQEELKSALMEAVLVWCDLKKEVKELANMLQAIEEAK